MRFTNRNEFLEGAKDDLVGPNMDKLYYLLGMAVKTNNKKLLDYENFVKIGAENNRRRINMKEYAQLLKKVYTFWYYHALKERFENPQTPGQRERIKEEIFDIDRLKPENIKDGDIFDICSYFEDRFVGWLKFPTYFQDKYFCHLYVNELLPELKEKEKFTEVRLYLKIKVDNVVKLTDILIDNAIKNKVPFVIKFAIHDNRNDNYVIYTDYDNIKNVVDLIEITKRENPHLFDGCKVKNPLMATYKKYMGFGEEPFLFGSYNSVRVDALLDAYKELRKEYSKDNKGLTVDNIKKELKIACEKLWIDFDNFCMNSKNKYKEYNRC